MGNIISLEDRKKEKVYNNSILYFSYVSYLYEIEIDITRRNFKKFNDVLFDIYKRKNEIYKYENDMVLFLETAVSNTVSNNKKRLNLETILDSIFEIKTNNKNNYQKIKK